MYHHAWRFFVPLDYCIMFCSLDKLQACYSYPGYSFSFKYVLILFYAHGCFVYFMIRNSSVNLVSRKKGAIYNSSFQMTGGTRCTGILANNICNIPGAGNSPDPRGSGMLQRNRLQLQVSVLLPDPGILDSLWPALLC